MEDLLELSIASKRSFFIGFCWAKAFCRDAERLAASVVLPEGIKFQQARKWVRDALTEAGISPRIDDLVARLLDET